MSAGPESIVAKSGKEEGLFSVAMSGIKLERTSTRHTSGYPLFQKVAEVKCVEVTFWLGGASYRRYKVYSHASIYLSDRLAVYGCAA